MKNEDSSAFERLKEWAEICSQMRALMIAVMEMMLQVFSMIAFVIALAGELPQGASDQWYQRMQESIFGLLCAVPSSTELMNGWWAILFTTALLALNDFNTLLSESPGEDVDWTPGLSRIRYRSMRNTIALAVVLVSACCFQFTMGGSIPAVFLLLVGTSFCGLRMPYLAMVASWTWGNYTRVMLRVADAPFPVRNFIDPMLRRM